MFLAHPLAEDDANKTLPFVSKNILKLRNIWTLMSSKKYLQPFFIAKKASAVQNLENL